MPDDEDALQLGDNTTINNGNGLIPLIATLIGGTGLGAAAAMYYGLGGQPDAKGQEAPPAAQATDSDTQYEFKLGFPD